MFLFRLLFVLVATLAPAWAQETASISGKVEDATGTPVSGATIAARKLRHRGDAHCYYR